MMRYRAHMLRGELTIEPAAGGAGTRIACTLLQPDPDSTGTGLAADGTERSPRGQAAQPIHG